MTYEDDFTKFIKKWARKFMYGGKPSNRFNPERKDPYEDWSKNFLSYYERKESEKKVEEDSRMSFIERSTSNFLDYLEKIERKGNKFPEKVRNR